MSNAAEITTRGSAPQPLFARQQSLSLLVGLGGIGLSAFGWMIAPDQFYRSYLFAWVFWVGLAIGCLPVQMIHHMTGGAWGLVIRRPLEAGARTLPLMLLLFVPVVIGALMWSFLYSPRFGPAGTLFDVVGLPTPEFLAADTIFGSLVNIVTWQWSGYYMVVIYAALRSIDPSVYEAARIDGANGWQTALRIKVPMISSSMVMVITFALIGTLQFFTEPTVLRNIAQGAIDELRALSAGTNLEELFIDLVGGDDRTPAALDWI